jgi:hypothetical protein
VINKQDFGGIELTDAVQTGFECFDLENPMDERSKDALRANFDRKLKNVCNSEEILLTVWRRFDITVKLRGLVA